MVADLMTCVPLFNSTVSQYSAYTGVEIGRDLNYPQNSVRAHKNKMLRPRVQMALENVSLFKGALDKFNIIPNFFPKKVGIFIPLEVLA